MKRIQTKKVGERKPFLSRVARKVRLSVTGRNKINEVMRKRDLAKDDLRWSRISLQVRSATLGDKATRLSKEIPSGNSHAIETGSSLVKLHTDSFMTGYKNHEEATRNLQLVDNKAAKVQKSRQGLIVGGIRKLFVKKRRK